MARLIFSMNVSLDGFVDHDRFAPDPVLFRHFVDAVGALAGSVYGRRMYEIMRYWDQDSPDWNRDERAFADVWRRQPKWVVSRTLSDVGPNATLVHGDDLEATLRRLKADVDGPLDVVGPELAQGVADLGLIDQVQLYVHPVVLGSGRRFFQRAWPRLRLVASERVGPDVIKLTYTPA